MLRHARFRSASCHVPHCRTWRAAATELAESWTESYPRLQTIPASFLTGTMFEYLMPALWMRSYPDTLIARTLTACVQVQRAFARSLNIPWGISESGFASKDDTGHYQYRAFGIPQQRLNSTPMPAQRSRPTPLSWLSASIRRKLSVTSAVWLTLDGSAPLASTRQLTTRTPLEGQSSFASGWPTI